MAQALINRKFQKVPILLAIIVICATLFGCSKGEKKADSFDRQLNLSQQEIKETIYGNRSKEISGSKIPEFKPIPKSSRMIAIPSFPKEKVEKLISFSVTEDVPLKDVLIELAKSANLDIDLDPQISGGVIVNARNRPLIEILDRVCEMGDLRYTLANNRLHVERDAPFSKNYSLDFLNDGELWNVVPQNVQSLLQTGSKTSSGGSISVNKLANIMTIFASQKNHIKVSEYLDSVRKSSSAQVLIEAKVVEVVLSDDYQTGIDWNWAGEGKSSVAQSGGVDTTAPLSIILGANDLLGGTINATISALSKFGEVKAISSPRINALNNQKATLNFTKKLVYFTYDVSENTNSTSTTSSTTSLVIDSTLNEVLTGIELAITPVIDLDSNNITLSVEPKITVQSDTVKEPVVNPNDTSQVLATSLIPIINTRELKTVAKIQNGNVLVIGGVMSEDSSNVDSGIPFFKDLPIIGNLFKSVSKTSSVTETVIFIKATIINPSDGVGKYDRKIHNNFTSSSRPFFDSK